MHNLINSLINIIDNYTKYDFYIGQTNNPKQRLKQHKQSKNFNFMIVIYKSSKEIIDILEYSLINKYKSYANNMNNQTYENNTKTIINPNVIIPDVNKIEDVHYLYIAFPFVVKVVSQYIDILNIKVDDNNRIKVNSTINYTKKKTTAKTPRVICEDKIKTLISQYHFNYRFMKIRSTNKEFKTFKAFKENKNYMIKMIYKNSDTKLINELKKEFQNTEYSGIINLKENKIKSLFHRSNKDDKLYIAFIK